MSVSGGGYTNGGLQLALTGRDGKAAGPGGAKADDVFSPGSVEEDHLRRHSSYLSDGLGQWLVAFGVLFRNLLASLLVLGLTVAAVGLAIGFFYRHVPIVAGGLQTIHTRMLAVAGTDAPGFPSVPWGVTLGVAAFFGLVLLLYVAELVWWSLSGSRPAVMAVCDPQGLRSGPCCWRSWVSAFRRWSGRALWVTWHLGISSKPVVAACRASPLPFRTSLFSRHWAARSRS